MSGRFEIWYVHFFAPLVCPCEVSCQYLDFCRIHAQKSTKNHYFAVFYSIKTDFLMSGRFEIWYVYFSAPSVCPCTISCQCLDFCRSHAQKGTKTTIFAVFYSIKTDFLMSGRFEVWYVHFLAPQVCPCEVSSQCLAFCRTHAQKSTKNHFFAVFYSIKTDFPMSGRFEIWYVYFSAPLVCPCKISCQCLDFCRSHAQKGTESHYFAVFYSIKTDFLMSGKFGIWYIHF